MSQDELRDWNVTDVPRYPGYKTPTRPSLELKVNGDKPHTSFCLKPQQWKEVMWWMKGLKFPDGYTAGLRQSMNMMTWKIIGLESHDYHIIMERLLLVMCWGILMMLCGWC
jgi:hypothetical protein